MPGPRWDAMRRSERAGIFLGMTTPNPLRVAVIGSGPAAFFTAEPLLARDDLGVSVDMFERLPAPFGLVRFGVAPDHQKIKSVTRSFEKVARRPGFRFFGNVDVGTHLTLEDLRRHYHVVCFATGAQTDRRLGIPGEDLVRSHPATEFVAWYNGHPEFRHHVFDLSVQRGLQRHHATQQSVFRISRADACGRSRRVQAIAVDL